MTKIRRDFPKNVYNCRGRMVTYTFFPTSLKQALKECKDDSTRRPTMERTTYAVVLGLAFTKNLEVVNIYLLLLDFYQGSSS
ncbi:hypothetical protein C5167_047265 [Papaver somniferum]|uniref:Uncharacterized protein n=1 Tax=Papaver somniferum TaxID=3469 RepID=A0A4Y7LGV6_PAPSO|nr:hypothetical protein C5167_047265 [Papaver somniferum]